jgi:hypothetical protein
LSRRAASRRSRAAASMTATRSKAPSQPSAPRARFISPGAGPTASPSITPPTAAGRSRKTASSPRRPAAGTSPSRASRLTTACRSPLAT